MSAAFRHDLAFNATRAFRLLKREGLAGIPKGIRYLARRLKDEIARRRILRAASPQARFTEIYRTRFWPGKESVSGPGSSLNSTANLRKRLPALFKEFSVARMLDAPCGDFAWMRHVVRENPAVQYLGGDIVEPLIAENLRRYGREGVRFAHLDITKGPLPEADLWMCRDCLCHLSLEDIYAALRRFAEARIPYFLTSTWPHKDGCVENGQIRSGDFRRIDLFSAPFSFPKPLRVIADQEDGSTLMCLWSREQLLPIIKRLS